MATGCGKCPRRIDIGKGGAEFVARSTPDGYTLMIAPPSPLVTNKSLFAKLGYEPESFVPVSVISMAPLALLVHHKLPAESVQELIVLAKASPGRVNAACDREPALGRGRRGGETA